MTLLASTQQTQASSLTDDLTSCDALYSQRGTQSYSAFECYLPLFSSAQTESLKATLLERMLVSLSAVINDLPKSPLERKSIDQGLKLLSELKKTAPESSEYFYWKACFTSFDVIEKDRGATIPTHTFRALGAIQDGLRMAIQKDPSIHFYGPMRVMGIMHTQMPGIAGGDKKLAEKMLREAYTRSPIVAMNHIAFAKILEINGKTTEAVEVLNRLLSTPDEALNPYPDQPLLNLAPETRKHKEEARKLLEEINE